MNPYDINGEGGFLGILYIKTGHLMVPKWAVFFSDIFTPKKIGLETKSARAVLVVTLVSRI